MSRFKVFKLNQDVLEKTTIFKDTVTECIYEAEYSDLERWVIYDAQLKIVVKFNIEDSQHSFTKPAIRIAGQDIEEGRSVHIPPQLVLKRGSSEITLWDKDRLDNNIKNCDSKPSTHNVFLDKFRILQIFPDYILVEGFQVSSTTLKTEISKRTKITYDKNLIPFNFKRNKLKLYRDKNKILFI